MIKAKNFYLILEKKEKIAPKVHAFYFSTDDDFAFTAGQYVQLTLPHKNVDDRGTSRFFSISSSPQERHVMISVKDGTSSFKKALTSLQNGESIQAFGPMGKFVLEVN